MPTGNGTGTARDRSTTWAQAGVFRVPPREPSRRAKRGPIQLPAEHSVAGGDVLGENCAWSTRKI